MVVERLDGVIANLLEASHLLPPDDLNALVCQELSRVGLQDPCAYIVDHRQLELVPLPPSEEARIAVDGTLPGRAYQNEEPLTASTETGIRVWLPLRNGVHRLGLLGVTAPQMEPNLVQRLMHVATVVTEILLSKMQYGDNILRAARLEPMALTAELRWAMLPPLTFSTPSMSIACALEPAYQVAGDAFDYALNGSVLHFAIFDAKGHELEAARVANLALVTYRNGRRADVSMEELYINVGEIIGGHCGDEAFVTGILATLDIDKGTVCFVNAGHPPMVHLRRRHGIADPRPGESNLPFGLGSGKPVVSRLSLEPGDRLLVVTDGILEIRNAAGGAPFGTQKLVDIVERTTAETHSTAEAVRRVTQAVVAHHGGQLSDDATVMLVSWEGPAD